MDQETEMWSIGEVSKFVGVSEKVLRTWDRKEILPAVKTEGGHRRYVPETVRDFIKSNTKDQIKCITTEFAQSDITMQSKSADREVSFWDSKGYLPVATESNKTDRTTLAVLLTNQMIANDHENTLDDEFVLTMLLRFWDHLCSKNIVHIAAMRGPTDLHYRWSGNALESDVLTAATVKMKSRLFHHDGESPKEAKLVDHLYQETKSVKIQNSIAHHSALDRPWLADYNGRRFAAEVDTEIVADLWKMAAPTQTRLSHLFETHAGINFLITNDLGIHLLEHHYGFRPTQTNGVGMSKVGNLKECLIYHHTEIDGMVIGKSNMESVLSDYVYGIYVFHHHSPATMAVLPTEGKDEAVVSQGSLMRRGKVTWKKKNNPLLKVIF